MPASPTLLTLVQTRQYRGERYRRMLRDDDSLLEAVQAKLDADGEIDKHNMWLCGLAWWQWRLREDPANPLPELRFDELVRRARPDYRQWHEPDTCLRDLYFALQLRYPPIAPDVPLLIARVREQTFDLDSDALLLLDDQSLLIAACADPTDERLIRLTCEQIEAVTGSWFSAERLAQWVQLDELPDEHVEGAARRCVRRWLDQLEQEDRDHVGATPEVLDAIFLEPAVSSPAACRSLVL